MYYCHISRKVSFSMSNKMNHHKDDNERIERIFYKLKPVCDQVALSPSVKTIEQLKEILKDLDPQRLNQFDDYILIPILMHLSNRNEHKCNTICSLLECLHIVLERTSVTNFGIFLKIFILTFGQIFDEKEPHKLASTSEELKLNVVRCVTALIKKADHLVLEEFYSKLNYGKLSMGVFACTRIAVNETSIELRVEALKALLYLTQVHSKNYSSQEYKQKVVSVLMLMVPGIVSHCLKVATSPDTQNHKITSLAVRLWSRVVGLAMEDILSDKDGVKTFNLEKKSSGHSEDSSFIWPSDQTKAKEMIHQHNRSQSWINYSNNHLAPVTESFTKLQSHHHSKVRLELVHAANCILSKAPRNMDKSVPNLVEALIILSQDEQPEVKSASVLAIKQFSHYCENNEGVKMLVEVVEESMYDLITRLPRILRGADLTLKERQLCLVSGYLDILGHSHVPNLLKSVQHLRRILTSLYLAATIDSSNISLLEEVSLRSIDEESSASGNSKWKTFKWCDTHKSQSIIEQICKKLVKFSGLSLFTHFLLDDFNSDVRYRKEVTQLFCFIFSSGTANSKTEVDTSINVFKTLMDLNLWSLPVNISEIGGVTKEIAKNNVVQLCLLLETVPSLGHFIGKEYFSPLLVRCLYPILECAGSPLHTIARTGLKSLRRVAELYGKDVGSLLSSNVDYLSNHITLNLRHAHRNPRVLCVLSVILNNSSFEVLPYLHELINDILIQSCDRFQEINAMEFLQVFDTFLVCLKNWNIDQDISEETTVRKSIVEELLDFQRTKLVAEQLTSDENNSDNEEEKFVEEKTFSSDLDKDKIKFPNHFKLTVQILERSLHFLPSKQQSRQLIVLQILENGILLIQKWTDELLPLVHKIWSPLVQRFHNCDNHLLFQRSFSLLKTLGKVSKQFIRSRTLQQVLPILCETLKQSAKDSINCNNEASYKLSQQYKLQHSLVNGIGELCIDLEFNEKELDSVLKVLCPYLSDLQPITLQNACIDSLKLISQHFPDLIWLHLTSIYPRQLALHSPIASFPSYEFQDKSKEMKDFKKNVNILLEYL